MGKSERSLDDKMFRLRSGLKGPTIVEQVHQARLASLAAYADRSAARRTGDVRSRLQVREKLVSGDTYLP